LGYIQTPHIQSPKQSYTDGPAEKKEKINRDSDWRIYEHLFGMYNLLLVSFQMGNMMKRKCNQWRNLSIYA
jgi:hypothetical protein